MPPAQLRLTPAYRPSGQQVQKVLAKLPCRCRTALVLPRWGGLSYEEFAAEMNVSVHSVKKYVAHAGLISGTPWDKHTSKPIWIAEDAIGIGKLIYGQSAPQVPMLCQRR